MNSRKSVPLTSRLENVLLHSISFLKGILEMTHDPKRVLFAKQPTLDAFAKHTRPLFSYLHSMSLHMANKEIVLQTLGNVRVP